MNEGGNKNRNEIVKNIEKIIKYAVNVMKNEMID